MGSGGEIAADRTQNLDHQTAALSLASLAIC
jgi:hypothetical protein